MPDLKTEIMNKVLPTWLEPKEEAVQTQPQTQTTRLYLEVKKNPGLEAREYAVRLKEFVSAANLTSLLAQMKARGYLRAQGKPMRWYTTDKVYAPDPKKVSVALALQPKAVAARVAKTSLPKKVKSKKVKPASKQPASKQPAPPKGTEALIASWTPQYARQVYLALKELFG